MQFKIGIQSRVGGAGLYFFCRNGMLIHTKIGGEIVDGKVVLVGGIELFN